MGLLDLCACLYGKQGGAHAHVLGSTCTIPLTSPGWTQQDRGLRWPLMFEAAQVGEYSKYFLKFFKFISISYSVKWKSLLLLEEIAAVIFVSLSIIAIRQGKSV